MTRPQFEVADIIRSAGKDFVERNGHWLRWTHLKVTPPPKAACPSQLRADANGAASFAYAPLDHIARTQRCPRTTSSVNGLNFRVWRSTFLRFSSLARR
jgi:hypothetical protein